MRNFPECADIETASGDYATRFAGEVGQYFLKVQLESVLRLLSKYESPRILDVGGGHAQLAVPLAKLGYDVTVTGSDESCEDRLRAQLPNGNYTFKVCNILETEYEEESFDVVLAFRLLPHVDRWEELITELCRVSSKGIIVDYPDIRSSNILNDVLFRMKKNMEGNTRPFLLFKRKQIQDKFSAGGFDLESFNPEFFLPMVLHRKLGSALFSQVSENIMSRVGATALFGSPIIAHFHRREIQ